MAGGSFCSRCGKPLKVGQLFCDCGGPVNPDSLPQGSSLAHGTSETSGLCILLTILSVLAAVVAIALAGAQTAGTLAVVLAAAGVALALLGRIAQAGRQHAEMMDELRRRQ
ncbi:MAG: hypothetical protein JXA87_08975 [Thermoleophilia bacterium]|nr:hypothetical protein [Thermoleophilia bacterium]